MSEQNTRIGPKIADFATSTISSGPGPVGITLTERQRVMGDIGLWISSDGCWHYQNGEIERDALVKLFASVLTRDQGGQHWLITPAEVCPIHVEDAPFLAVSVVCQSGLTCSSDSRVSDEPTIILQTNLGDNVTVDEEHPIFLREPLRQEITAPSDSQKDTKLQPYVRMSGGLEAKLTRSVYYELSEQAVEETFQDDHFIGIRSRGTFFPLA